jgi:dTDP-4-dehydrorhamnose 3,5-epimerase
MRFTETALEGAFIIDIERREDERGFFARTFCTREFEAHGLKPTFVQCHTSLNHRAGTLRGMHYQVAPAAETKLVRCTSGAICDIIVDLRPASPTYLEHVAVELTADGGRQLYVPEMFAHGFVTLAEHTEIAYQVGGFYAPEHERGLRYDDPALGISWPVTVRVISRKDANWPLMAAGTGAGARE